MAGETYGMDPHAVARRIQAERRGWCCWYGTRTGSYWAVPYSPGPRTIAEGTTPAQLVAEMTRIESAYQPWPPMGRGR